MCEVGALLEKVKLSTLPPPGAAVAVAMVNTARCQKQFGPAYDLLVVVTRSVWAQESVQLHLIDMFKLFRVFVKQEIQ